MKNQTPQKKHVIILGAGASLTSGYPLANKLRLLMTSERKAWEELQKNHKTDISHLNDTFAPMFSGTGGQIDGLFRDGVFATVDEFSYLAGPRFSEEIQSLKRRLRFALALHNPEDNSDQSDYYPFIQRLFQRGIFPLRDDIAILTFNYDPYLAFLLRRAVRVRYKAAGKAEGAGLKDLAVCEHSVTSGFCGGSKVIEKGDGLCLLHLHGIVAWPDKFKDTRAISFDEVFQSNLRQRLTNLHPNTPPPIVFPWEILNEQGEFRPKDEFCLYQNTKDHCPFDIHELFVAIWKRAQREINSAEKISFVGLSMHEFLNPAFAYLFREKTDGAKIVVANKELERFRVEDHVRNNPRSPVFKIEKLLKNVWPWRKRPGNTITSPRPHDTFEEFIRNEME
jgi:hypothetical protein